MEDITTLLIDLDGFTVVSVLREDDDGAHAVETWWPAVEAFLRLRVTNARPRATPARLSRSRGPPAGSGTGTPTRGASCSTTPRPRHDQPFEDHEFTSNREEPT